MRIKWKSVYGPLGEWVTQNNEVIKISKNFKATFNNEPILVIFREVNIRGGHGEGSFEGRTPMFVKEETLEEIKLNDNDFIIVQ